MSCAADAVTRFAAPLGESPVVDGGTYTSGGGLTVAAEIREDRGLTAVCGVWALSRHQSVLTINRERDVLARSSVFLGDDRLVQGLLFMRQVRPMAAYGAQDAGCVRTDRPWRDGDGARRPKIRIPRQTVVRESSDGDTGPVVEFVQTGAGAGGG